MTAFSLIVPVPRRLLGRVVAGLLLVLAALPPAAAELRIDITRGVVEPLPIAIVPFDGGNNAQTARTGEDMAAVISADLERSGLFRPLDPRSFAQQQPPSMDALPRFSDWRTLNVPALVYGRIVAADDGRLKVEFRLWDVFAEQQLAGLAYFTAPANWRRIPISSPMRSISASPARTATSIPGWSTSPKAGRRASGSSGWRSWTRMAPTTASSPMADRWC